jgi:hypothetical protein
MDPQSASYFSFEKHGSCDCALMHTGPPKTGAGPSEKIVSPPSNQGGAAINLYTKQERTDSQVQSDLGLV